MTAKISQKKYLSFFRLHFSAGLQYRAAALAGIATQFAWGAFEILMYEAFWRSDPSAFPMERSSLYSYIWLQQGFLSLYMLWIFDHSIFESIANGGVALELCRPYDIYTMWFVKNCSARLSRAILRCVPIFIFAFLLPEPFALRFPNDPILLLLSAISLILAFIIVNSITMLIYISSFHTIDSRGIRLVVVTIGEFCAGGVIPLPFLPDRVRELCELLPFASSESTPLLIFSQALSGIDAVRSVLIQLIWAIILISIGRLWMKSSLKKVTLQGG